MAVRKPDSCKLCPLFESGKGFCPDNVPDKTKVLLIAEAPDKTEVTQGVAMSGSAGFVLQSWILRAVPSLQMANERGQLGYANTLRCLPPETQGKAYPTGKDKDEAEKHCRQYDKWPASVETVILLGEHSQRLHFSKELETEDAVDRALGHSTKGVMGRIGRVYEKDGKRWVFGPHPAFVLRQPSLVRHAQEAFRIATGEDKTLELNYMQWNEAVKELLSL